MNYPRTEIIILLSTVVINVIIVYRINNQSFIINKEVSVGRWSIGILSFDKIPIFVTLQCSAIIVQLIPYNGTLYCF